VTILYDAAVCHLYEKLIMFPHLKCPRWAALFRVMGTALLLGLGHLTPAAAAQADFSGTWTVDWCDKRRPSTECGGFTVHLLQKGDRICGTHSAASPGLSRLDEGADRSIVGLVVGRTAVLTIQSGRSEGIYLVSARKRTVTIDWRRTEMVKAANGDTDLIANRALMHKTTPIEGDQGQASMRAACQAYWASTQ
jgi:hypothetical protein